MWYYLERDENYYDYAIIKYICNACQKDCIIHFLVWNATIHVFLSNSIHSNKHCKYIWI